MTFVSVPNSGQTLGGTRDQIRTNMDDTRNQITVNHVDVNLAGAGKHKFIQMPEQTTYPLTPVNEGQLLAREYNLRTELAWRPENLGATADQYILSGMPIRAAMRFDPNVPPGNVGKTAIGLKFNVASVTKSATSTYDVLFDTQFPIGAASANYMVLALGLGGSLGYCAISNMLATGFTITSSETIGINFIVLGG